MRIRANAGIGFGAQTLRALLMNANVHAKERSLRSRLPPFEQVKPGINLQRRIDVT